jgi:hypothetical protein
LRLRTPPSHQIGFFKLSSVSFEPLASVSKIEALAEHAFTTKTKPLKSIDRLRAIEIRRHSRTKKAGHVAAALTFLWKVLRWREELGGEIGSFDLVLTSTVPCTVETAIAMGFAVDDQLEVLGDLRADVWEEIGHHDRWSWAEPFVTFAQFVRQGGPTSKMGKQQRDAWVRALESVPTGRLVLIISHGRIIEPGLVTCLPDADF